MAFESRVLRLQRRPVATPPTAAIGHRAGRSYARVRRRKFRASSLERVALVALVVFAAVLLPTGFYRMRRARFGRGTVGGDVAIGDKGRLSRTWKPHPGERSTEIDGLDLGAAEHKLKAVLFEKESGVTTNNNDEPRAHGSIRNANAKANKVKAKAKDQRHSSYYRPKFDDAALGYDIYNCPADIPRDYPKAWKATEVLGAWNPNDVTADPASRQREIYQGLCIFDYQTQYDVAKVYRDAEQPFIIRNDLNVMAATNSWHGDPEYLLKRLPEEKVSCERSPGNHFMFYRAEEDAPPHWTPPRNDVIRMTYREWLERALDREAQALDDSAIASRVDTLRRERQRRERQDGGKPHGALDDDETVEDHDTEDEKRLKWYYLRINAYLDDAAHGTDQFVFDELPFFDPRRKDAAFYFVDPDGQRGINCRFGMRGIVAENHMDMSRNMIALLGGARRYIIGHPSQCERMALYPKAHPSGRHSSFDWSNPAEWDLHPEFKQARVSEVVLQGGDVLFLPTAWFHYIVNLSRNVQCNIRSGIGHENMEFVHRCGFRPGG